MHEMNRSQISEEKWEGTDRENKTASAGENKSAQF